MNPTRTLTALGVATALLLSLLGLTVPAAHAAPGTEPGTLQLPASTPSGEKAAPDGRAAVVEIPAATGQATPGQTVELLIYSPAGPVVGRMDITAPAGTTITKVRDNGSTSAGFQVSADGRTASSTRPGVPWGASNLSAWVTLRVDDTATPGTVLTGGTATIVDGTTLVARADLSVTVVVTIPAAHGSALPGQSVELRVYDPVYATTGLLRFTAPAGTTITKVSDNGAVSAGSEISADGRTATTTRTTAVWGAGARSAWVTLTVDDVAVPGTVLSGGTAQVVSGTTLVAQADLSVTVTGQIVITQHPVDTTVVEGAPATFTTAATGHAVTTRWQLSTDAGATWADVPGAAGATLTTTGTSRDMNAWVYRAVHTNAAGSVPTAPAVLRTRTAPVFTVHPPAVLDAGSPGTVLSLHAVATETSGDVSHLITWETSMDGVTRVQVPDGVQHLVASAEMDGMLVRAAVTTDLGSAVSDPAQVTVAAAPVVDQHPVDVRTLVGGDVTFTASTPAVSPHRTQQWQERAGTGGWTDLPGATAASLTLDGTTLDMDQRQYRIVFTNLTGSTASQHATLTVHRTPPQARVTITPTVRLVDALPPTDGGGRSATSPAPGRRATGVGAP